MKINQPTHAEELLMHILWQLDSAYLKDIIAHYPEPRPHQNTVSTFMKILVDKEFLTTQKEGRIFKYTVVVPFTKYRNFLLNNFLSRYYENSASELLQNLTDENLLTASEIHMFFERKDNTIPLQLEEDKTLLSDFINEITSGKKQKKKGKKKKKKN